MKITEIHIASFGGLKNKTITPHHGFNIIYGDNEAGKTTVITFIRAIFYGAGAKRGADLSKKIREKYAPWNGEPMMGSVTFEHEGARYRIERSFGKTERQDNATLFNLDLGTKEKVTESLGERFFGVDLEAFTRCFFIADGGKIDSGDGELSGKLSAIAQTGDEDISRDTVIKNLSHGKELLVSRSGRKGTLVDDRASRLEILSRLREAENCEEQINLLVRRQDEAEEKLKLRNEKREKLSAILDRRHKLENIKRRQMLSDRKKELQKLDEMLICSDGSAITRDTVATLRSAYDEKETLISRIEENKAETELARTSCSTDTAQDNIQKIEDAKKQLSIFSEKQHRLRTDINGILLELSRANADAAAKKERKKPISVPLLAVTLLFMIVGAVIFALRPPMPGAVLGAASFGVAVIALFFAFLLRPADKKAVHEAEENIAKLESAMKEAENELSFTEQSIRECEDQITLMRTNFDKEKARREGELAALSERGTKLESQLSEAEARARQLLFSVCGESNTSLIPVKISELTELISKHERIEMQINLILDQLGDADTDSDTSIEKDADDTDISSIDFDAIALEASQLDSEITELRSISVSAKTELRTRSESFENPESIKKDLDLLDARIAEKERFVAASELAAKIIEESYAELRSDYGGLIESKTIDIFSRLTEGRYKNVTVSDGFDISAEQSDFFGTREIGYLSTGTADQAYLSLRLAIADMISGESRIPIMMDDTLSQYDDTRASRALSFLAEYASKTQILLFTCHGHLRDKGEQAGADIIYL